LDQIREDSGISPGRCGSGLSSADTERRYGGGWLRDDDDDAMLDYELLGMTHLWQKKLT